MNPVDQLAEIVASGYCVGAQAYVSLRGRVVMSSAIGERLPSEPMREDTVHALYCLTKPVVAIAALKLAEDSGLSLDAPFGNQYPRVQQISGDQSLTLRQLLQHRGGMERPRAAEVMFTRRVDRADLVERACQDRRTRTDENVYSEFLAWHVVRVWIEEQSGVPVDVYLRNAVLDPLGLRDMYFGMALGTSNAIDRIGVLHEMFPEGSRPLWHELLETRCNDPYLLAVGGHGTMAALGRFYELVAEGLTAAHNAGLPSADMLREAVRPGRPYFDQVLNRHLAFGLGFMTRLEVSLASEIDSDAFGHLGFMGNSFAFVDPKHSLVCAVLLNRFVFSSERSIVGTRERLIRCIYEEFVDAA